jgi:IS5 family transposase
MLAINRQLEITEFGGLYDRIVPEDHILRRIKDEIDFSFVNPMLTKSYCEAFGRPAKEPEMMFKLLFLKKLYDLSDAALMDSANVNMAYKYFLNVNPEAGMPDSSLLTKFRKLRLTEDILSDLLKETVRQAIEKGLIKSGSILVDSTHIRSLAGRETPTATLRRMSKELRREIYQTQYDLSDKFPEKPVETADLAEEISYSRALLDAVRHDVEKSGSEKARRLLDVLSEACEIAQNAGTQSLTDPDAKVGFKSENNSFFGYKAHIAMTEERIVTGLEVTGGNRNDGAELQNLAEQSMDNGVSVTEIIGDKAYSSRENIEYARSRGAKLISALHPVVSNGKRTGDDGFQFNKDADRMQCPAGHLANKKKLEHRGSARNDRMKYWWDTTLCRTCPLKEICLKLGAKSRTYSVTILGDTHAAQKEFQETEYFKSRMKERYMIEAKNSELKHSHGLARADSVGLAAVRLQTYLTVFAANVKRIVRLSAPTPA